MLLYHLYFPNANEFKRLVYKFFYVICDPPKYTYTYKSLCPLKSFVSWRCDLDDTL